MAETIKLTGVNKTYGDKVKTQVLFDMNLAFEAGSFNSIIGAFGSGKSTLLNIMGTLDTPSSGEVEIGGRSVSKLSKNALAVLRNETIGFIFQFHHLLPEFTAIENFLIPYRIQHGKLTKEARERALELMDLVGVAGVRNNRSTDMSGGQQQRTAIARALINNPQINLADESTGNLDSESTDNIYTILRDINKRFGTTFVIITHDKRIAERTDRVVEIRDGRVNLDVTKN